jgi:hypothetical protein
MFRLSIKCGSTPSLGLSAGGGAAAAFVFLFFRFCFFFVALSSLTAAAAGHHHRSRRDPMNEGRKDFQGRKEGRKEGISKKKGQEERKVAGEGLGDMWLINNGRVCASLGEGGGGGGVCANRSTICLSSSVDPYPSKVGPRATTFRARSDALNNALVISTRTCVRCCVLYWWLAAASKVRMSVIPVHP